MRERATNSSLQSAQWLVLHFRSIIFNNGINVVPMMRVVMQSIDHVSAVALLAELSFPVALEHSQEPGKGFLFFVIIVMPLCRCCLCSKLRFLNV